MSSLNRLLSVAALGLSVLVGDVWAEDVVMARSRQAFPEAMLTLQESVREHGYQVSRVQRIDIGLTGMGYATDKYRVVFVGKTGEIRHLKQTYPELIPYLPPKISIFAEGDETILTTTNPLVFKQFVKLAPEDELIFDHWESDLRSVLDDVREAE